MAKTLEIGVSNLLPEFLADALVFLGPFQTAGAVAAGTLQTFFDHLDHFFIVIQSYSHGGSHPFGIHYTIGEGNVKDGEIKKKRPSFRMTFSLVGEAGLEPARPQ